MNFVWLILAILGICYVFSGTTETFGWKLSDVYFVDDYWSKKLNKLLRSEDTEITFYENHPFCKVNEYFVWTGNYPHGYGHRIDLSGAFVDGKISELSGLPDIQTRNLLRGKEKNRQNYKQGYINEVIKEISNYEKKEQKNQKTHP